MYKITAVPAVLYECKTPSQNLREERRSGSEKGMPTRKCLNLCERREKGTGGICINCIKSSRMKWAGCVAGTGWMRN